MQRLRAFIAYAHEDEALKNEFISQITVLKNASMLEYWHDTDISAGSNWRLSIAEELDKANIFFFLISPAFLASDFIWSVEASRAMQRHQAGEVRIIPIILRPAHWAVTQIAQFQALPANGKAITTWDNSDAAFQGVLESITQTLQLMTGRTMSPGGTGQRAPVAGETFTDTTSGITFVWIPPGEFSMGREHAPQGFLGFLAKQLLTGDGSGLDETPAHPVSITEGFWIGQYPVTQGEWQKTMGSNPSYFRGVDKPVESVSQDDIDQYLKTLNTTRIGYRYRLPTEAEWEYAARAGSNHPTLGFQADQIAWWTGNSNSQTQPVGLKASNAWGLHDVLGNIWEWCSDFYDLGFSYYSQSPKSDPKGPISGKYHVCRGGCWYINHPRLRVTVRNWAMPPQPSVDKIFGFRCVLDSTIT